MEMTKEEKEKLELQKCTCLLKIKELEKEIVELGNKLGALQHKLFKARTGYSSADRALAEYEKLRVVTDFSRKIDSRISDVLNDPIKAAKLLQILREEEEGS